VAASSGADAAPAVRLSLLVAGACRQIERVARRGGHWRPIAFPALVGVIRHPTAGVVLYDTGYRPRFHAETARLPYWLYGRATPVRCRPEETAVAQLAMAGIAPTDVSLIIMSHFHADHVGGLNDFPAARFRYLRPALDPAWRGRSAVANVRHGFLPGHLPADFEERSTWVEDCHRVPVAGLDGGEAFACGFDLLGDGSLIGLDLSGHTPGQLGLLLPRTQGPPVALLGDACWNIRAITDDELPHPVTRLITADPRGYRARIAALRGLASARPELRLVPSHCQASIDIASRELA
jgi:glyoxylase-like metal-dependent hydrolase (beta-lactamase superfamily II)